GTRCEPMPGSARFSPAPIFADPAIGPLPRRPRAKLNARLQSILDEHTEVWGVKVTQVQAKQVDLPQEMQRAIAAQAEAERARRAKIINTEGALSAPPRAPR